jgi:hypothetical protein
LVTAPVAALPAEEVAADMTGSPVVLDGAAESTLEEATDDATAEVEAALEGAALLQPEIHPLAVKQ